ncbi:porin family protein [Aureibaculum sp. 2210JD6-5]|uniref:porin family protein n=1 Tax=Aureibaculum sp. 2210JD6-5 TaxID=3103957 RepID=UPI002AAD895D|nr:porin family protein [Aureibaculum sp. 2210JD6-5]MDY7396956.1 porin family protein [Aureibaculum sp. 2210JD6-5]
MKKYILTALTISLFINTTSFSQNEMRIGINAGANYSKFRGNELIDETNADFGFLAGVSLEYFLSEKFSLKTNLNFERKSIKKTSNNIVDFEGMPTGEIEIKTNYDYLVLPMLVKYKFNETSGFYVNGGPFLGYLLSNKSRAEGYDEDDFTSLSKKIDVGVSIGLGAKFQLTGKNELGIELRNNLGLINTSDVEVYKDGSIKSNSLNLLLTWDFEI